MPLLILFALLGGIVTILSPCILPILPIVLSGSVVGGKRRPFGVVAGFILSFTFFTLFLTAIVRATGISANLLRIIAVVVIASFGLSLLVARFQYFLERAFSKLANIVPQQSHKEGFWGGILVGISLGLVWTPCVGPILASIIALAASSKVGLDSVLVTLAYATGTALPLLAIVYGGRKLLETHPWLVQNSGRLQKAFGVLMIVTAFAIYFNWDRQFQAYVLEKFPSYGAGLTKIEDNAAVKIELEKLKQQKKSMFDVIENFGAAPELIPGGQWFNSAPLTMAELRGKVILIDFWTYTCINCIRTLPYIKSWWEKYKDKGLVIVGVHTPEFEFEKDPKNVGKAIKDFGLTYPIMQDNDYATWNAYANRYWPAKYFIDKNGKIRFTHFGEGSYDESEQRIITLLAETGVTSQEPVHNPEYQINAGTPETYLGYRRLSSFASAERIQQDKLATYSIPTTLPKNSVAYGGAWTVGEERAMPAKGAQLVFSFDAGEVFLVMRPKSGNVTAKIKVFLDDKEVIDAAGEDVKNGIVTINADRLYKLIKLTTPGSHVLRVDFLDDNAELYAFTFG